MHYNLYWFGNLTTGNVKEVGRLLSELLDGKFYTAITAHPVLYTSPSPEADVRMDVRPSQRLRPEGTRDGKAISAEIRTYGDGKEYASLSVFDSYGLYCLSSDLSDKERDTTYKNPYIVFEGNRVTIRHRAPAGNLLVWTFAVEDHAEY